MNKFCVWLTASSLSAAMVTSFPVQAMEIRAFDSMAPRDRQDYINLLMESAQKVLSEAGRQNEAAKAQQLFSEIHQGETAPRGEAEFERNLAAARVAAASNAPEARGMQVEEALAVTLKKNGIELPGSFFTVASKFLPPIAPTPSIAADRPDTSRPAPSDDDDPIGPGGFITPPQR